MAEVKDFVQGGIQILLVEDNEDDAFLTLRALSKVGIVNDVKHVKDGAEALDFLFARGQHENRDTSITPQLVLLDLNLPKLSGLDVLRHLREDHRTKLLPVVMLTSSRQEQDILESYQCGANSYVRKPVGSAEFLEAIQQLGFYWLIINTPPITMESPAEV